jgi:hypothetical protein
MEKKFNELFKIDSDVSLLLLKDEFLYETGLFDITEIVHFLSFGKNVILKKGENSSLQISNNLILN